MQKNDAQNDRLTGRSVRSFVIRNGRTTDAQSSAIERLLPDIGITYAESECDLASHFGRDAPVWLEIGFGNGDVLVNLAQANPAVNLIGVEVHTAGVGHALLHIEEQQLTNVRLIQHDAMEVLQNMLADSSLDRVMLLFPDPWHKKRHHKRRIVQPEFLDSVSRVLHPGGVLHCATDWAEYGQWMMDLLEADPRFANIAGASQTAPRPDWRPLTRFEKRGQRLGHSVVDLTYRKV